MLTRAQSVTLKALRRFLRWQIPRKKGGAGLGVYLRLISTSDLLAICHSGDVRQGQFAPLLTARDDGGPWRCSSLYL